ncbi:MAG: hypothetical protein OXN97_08350 [Bryobacterales bacterium]|nr:hypothetical protein [Bryobacterales bacterium]
MDYRIALGPVPAVPGLESLEQFPAALEQFLEGVEEQALAETPRARQEVMGALLNEPQGMAGLVHVVAVSLAELVKGLNADRKTVLGHGPPLT